MKVSKDIKPVATPKNIRDQYGVHVFRGPTPVYTAEQMQEYAISFAAFALKGGELIDLVTSEDYQKHAEELFKKFEETHDEEV